MHRPIIISDVNKKSLIIKKKLINILKFNIVKRSNLIIVIGGDGFMLQTLKKNNKPNNLFYGINSGNYGFLMNKFEKKKILNNLSKAKMISIFPLEMTVKKKTKTVKSLAINEVSILRQSKQAANLSIKITHILLLKISVRWCFDINTCRQHCI